MECSQIPPAILWGEDPEKREVYRRHLRSCLACRRRVLAQAPDELLFELQSSTLPQEFWTGFWESLEKKLHEREVIAPAASSYRFIRWAAVLAVALLVALFSQTLPQSSPIVQKSGVLLQQANAEEYPIIEDVQNPKATYYIIQAGANEKIIMLYDPDMEL